MSLRMYSASHYVFYDITAHSTFLFSHVSEVVLQICNAERPTLILPSIVRTNVYERINRHNTSSLSLTNDDLRPSPCHVDGIDDGPRMPSITLLYLQFCTVRPRTRGLCSAGTAGAGVC